MPCTCRRFLSINVDSETLSWMRLKGTQRGFRSVSWSVRKGLCHLSSGFVGFPLWQGISVRHRMVRVAGRCSEGGRGEEQRRWEGRREGRGREERNRRSDTKQVIKDKSKRTKKFKVIQCQGNDYTPIITLAQSEVVKTLYNLLNMQFINIVVGKRLNNTWW